MQYCYYMYIYVLIQTHHCNLEPKPGPLNVAKTLQQLRSMTPFQVSSFVHVSTDSTHALCMCGVIIYAVGLLHLYMYMHIVKLIEGDFVINYFQNEDESPLTKAVRLTSALVLRNLARTSPRARA